MNPKSKYFMSLAIELAKKGNPSPNPYVGAVIVKNGKIMGKGYHKTAGSPHAEIEAINSVKNKSDIEGSTLYVTLEPCSHYGKTPPCTDAIIKYKIKKVVFAVNDPTKKVKGEEILKKNNIIVKKNILKKKAQELNEIFFYNSKYCSPFISIKVSISSDGKISKINQRTKITGKEADIFSHKLRSKYDSILVGIDTVIIDNPRLTSRVNGGRNPLRIVLDPKLRIPLNSKVLIDKNVLVVSTTHADENKLWFLNKKGYKVLILGKYKISLKKLIKYLWENGITSILVEGGTITHTYFLKQKLVNKIYLFKSKSIVLGKLGYPSFNSSFLRGSKLISKIDFDEDILFIRYFVL